METLTASRKQVSLSFSPGHDNPECFVIRMFISRGHFVSHKRLYPLLSACISIASLTGQAHRSEDVTQAPAWSARHDLSPSFFWYDVFCR